MSPSPITQVADLWPALGFFGAHDSISWHVPLGKVVKGLRLTVDAGGPTFLNLQRVDLLTQQKPALAPDAVWTEHMSSVHSGAAKGGVRLLSGGSIHSESEERPWWRADFATPVHIDEIRVGNRRDTWARRSQHLMLEVQTPDGRWVVQRRNHGGDAVAHCIAELARLGVLATGPATEVAELRLAWIRQLTDRLSGPVDQRQVQPSWPQVLALLPLWDAAPLLDDELRLAAVFLLDQGLRQDDLAMSYLSAVLKTSAEVDRLTAAINEVAARRGEQRYMLTRHGLQRQGKLVSHRDAFLAAAAKAIQVLEADGREPVLAYGTLLGAVRSGEFIAHDDDLDLLCRVPAHDEASARREMERLVEWLNGQGFLAKFSSPSALNVHAIDRANGALIDIFPFWQVGDQVYLHMERMAIRGIDASLLTGRGEVSLHGRTYPAPSQREGFLQARYGDSWRTPLVHFEWPWALQDD